MYNTCKRHRKWPDEALIKPVRWWEALWRCHVAGAAYVGLQWDPHFQHRCHPMTASYFYWKLMTLTQWPPIFPFDLSHEASIQFQHEIDHFRWFCAQSSFLNNRNLGPNYKLLLWDWTCWNGSHRNTKNYIPTRCPHNFGPKCSLSPNEPIHFFFNFSITRCPMVRKPVPYIRAYTYIDFIYECLRGPSFIWQNITAC